MQYVMLIYETPQAFGSRTKEEDDAYIGAWQTYHRALVEADAYVGGSPLRAPETATTVRMNRTKRHVLDGPYAETKEQLGGFVIVELPSLDAALDWAARCPAASHGGAVEVRPLAPDLHDRVTRS